jgi:hypothetical protein
MWFIGEHGPEGWTGRVQEYFEGLSASWTTLRLTEAFAELRVASAPSDLGKR